MSARWEFIWEPTDQVATEGGVEADSATGLFYDILHVEKTNEGWLALLFEWFEPSEEDDAPAAFEAVDEDLFTTREEAVIWCELTDLDRYEGDPSWVC